MTTSSNLSAVKGLVFDVFGTVIYWRTRLITDFMWWSRQRGIVSVDWTALVDGWRGGVDGFLDKSAQSSRAQLCHAG